MTPWHGYWRGKNGISTPPAGPDAVSSQSNERAWKEVPLGMRIVDYRQAVSSWTPAQAFHRIQRVGGKQGWYFMNVLWWFRGWVDSLFGGVGLRRGRRDPVDLRVGDALDYWRVEFFEPGQRLRLRAEMKLPGRAWLEFEVKPHAKGCEIHQTAIFDPLGLWGPGLLVRPPPDPRLDFWRHAKSHRTETLISDIP
jgi:hypothetical protein